MRYAKNSLVISKERDIPLLQQVRNSRFVSHQQLYEFLQFRGLESGRSSFNWRVRRLISSGQIAVCSGVFGAGSTVYTITRDGLCLLEHHGQFTTVLNSSTRNLPHPSQALHSLELNRIQLALARRRLLAGWHSEVEVASFNTISPTPYEKDYDAVVEVWVEGRKVCFALEYERHLKSTKQYDRVRAALARERRIPCVLYLTSGFEVMAHLAQELESVEMNLAFSSVEDFSELLLDTSVLSSRRGAGVRFRDLLE